MRHLFTLIGLLLATQCLFSQFLLSPANWNVPNNFQDALQSGRVSGNDHATMDLNGDGLPDLIDGMDDNTNEVWGYSTGQPYWQVYLNNGSGFDLTPISWSVPNNFDSPLQMGRATGLNHVTVDLDGDGLPDLMDGMNNGNNEVWGYSNGTPYWRVYLNTGSGFNSTPVAWTVPNNFETPLAMGRFATANHSTIDLDGDGRPDLVDGINNGSNEAWNFGSGQPYWRVYLNTGNGFNTTPIAWTVPNNFESGLLTGRVSGNNHTTMDLDGDGMPDLIDGINNGSNEAWGYSNSQPYWRVYINTGNGFNTTPLAWTVPFGFEDGLQSGRVSSVDHTTLDLTNDGLPDLIDGINNTTYEVWGNGTGQRYWQVYLNNGNGFDATPYTWNVPNGFEDALQSGRVSRFDHTTIDINGDGFPDLVDGINNNTNSVFGNGTSQRYWHVYLSDYSVLVTSLTVQGTGGATSVVSGANLQMEATVSPVNATDPTYTWSVTNGTGTATIDPSGVLTGGNPGTVTVIATANDASQVTGSATITVDQATSRLADHPAEPFVLYPNPTKDRLSIDFPAPLTGATITVVSLRGELVFHTSHFQGKTLTLDLAGLPGGIYFLRVATGSKIWQEKIVKQE